MPEFAPITNVYSVIQLRFWEAVPAVTGRQAKKKGEDALHRGRGIGQQLPGCHPALLDAIETRAFIQECKDAFRGAASLHVNETGIFLCEGVEPAKLEANADLIDQVKICSQLKEAEFWGAHIYVVCCSCEGSLNNSIHDVRFKGA